MSHADTAGEWRQSGLFVPLTALGLTCAPTTLPVYTLGVFVLPFAAAFGWGRGQVQAAILFSTGLGVLGAPLAGAMVRRFGVRRTVLSGLAGLGLSILVAAAQTGALWQLYLAYALMATLGAGSGGVAWTTLISHRFAKSRGLALGLALSGTGLCAAVMPQIAVYGVALGGWRGGYLLLATVCLIVVLPACWALLPRDNAPAAPDPNAQRRALPGVSAGTAVRHWRFWALGLATACIYVVLGGIAPNLVPAMHDIGVDGRAAASIMGWFGMAVVLGRIVVGALIDRIWAPIVAAVVLVLAAIGCLALQATPDRRMVTAAVVLIGLATGTELDVLGYLTSRYFGLADYARIYGRLFVFVAATAGAGPMIFGRFFDVSGSYTLPLRGSAVLLCIGAAGLLCLGRFPAQFVASAKPENACL